MPSFTGINFIIQEKNTVVSILTLSCVFMFFVCYVTVLRMIFTKSTLYDFYQKKIDAYDSHCSNNIFGVLDFRFKQKRQKIKRMKAILGARQSVNHR